MPNVTALLTAHWPLLVVAFVIAIVGRVVKPIVLPRGDLSAKGWRWWYMMTLPLHSPAVGFLVGLIPGMPCPATICTTWLMRALYYTAAGVFSSFAYEALRHWAKVKLGVTENA